MEYNHVRIYTKIYKQKAKKKMRTNEEHERYEKRIVSKQQGKQNIIIMKIIFELRVFRLLFKCSE